MYWLLSVCSILRLFQTLGVDPWHHHRPPLSRPLNRFSQWETPTKDQSREERGAGECSPRKPHCCALAPRLRQWPRSPHDRSKGSNSSLSRVLWGLLSSKIRCSSNLGPMDISFSLAGTLAGPVFPETRAVCRGTASHPWAGSSEPALGKCPWLVTGQAVQVEQRRRSAERVQEFYAPSKLPRPPALCQLHVVLWRFARMPYQCSCLAAPEERSKFCTWSRLERHLPRSVDCAFWKARQAGWASLQE